MADDDGRNMTPDEAHTRRENSAAAAVAADPERAAKVGSTRAMTEAAMAGLAAQLGDGEGDAVQPSLLLADPDGEFCLFSGPVRHVAKTMDAAKRARGRPAGSQNRASRDLANYLLSMGYRDPAMNLADMANAKPADLAAELDCDPYDAMELIRKANAELLPYFHAKRPQEIKVDRKSLGVMIIGEMPTDRQADGKVMDMTRFDAPE